MNLYNIEHTMLLLIWFSVAFAFTDTLHVVHNLQSYKDKQKSTAVMISQVSLVRYYPKSRMNKRKPTHGVFSQGFTEAAPYKHQRDITNWHLPTAVC